MNLKMRREDLVVNVTETGNSHEPESVGEINTLTGSYCRSWAAMNLKDACSLEGKL